MDPLLRKKKYVTNGSTPYEEKYVTNGSTPYGEKKVRNEWIGPYEREKST